MERRPKVMRIRQRYLRGVGVGALSACLMLAAPVAHAGAWLADVKSGCQVWDPNPQLDETVIWSGACAKGRAEGSGTAQWFKAGVRIETDEGEWRDGRQTGKGIQTWPTGRYDGELSDGEPNGRGVLTLQKLRYEGEFRDGKPNGIGSADDWERNRARQLEGRMFTGRPAKRLDWCSIVGLPLRPERVAGGMPGEKTRSYSMEEAMRGLYLVLCCGLLGLMMIYVPQVAQGTGNQGQKLSDGAAMPLEGFQENMRVGESLSITGIVLQHLANGMIRLDDALAKPFALWIGIRHGVIP